MTQRIIGYLFFLITLQNGIAQPSFNQEVLDSLKHEISKTHDDTINLLLLHKIANTYNEINPDSAYYYAKSMRDIANKLNLKLEEVIALGEMGYALLNLGNYPRSLQTLLSAIAIAEDPASEKNILSSGFPEIDDFTDRSASARIQRLATLSRVQQFIGILYTNAGDFYKALNYYKTASSNPEQANNLRIMSITYTTMGRAYFSLKKIDTALFCLQKAYDFAIKADYTKYTGSLFLNMGRIYLAMHEPMTARDYFRKALTASTTHNYYRGIVASHLALSDLDKQSGKTDSSFVHIKTGLSTAYNLNAPDLLLRSYTALADYYKSAGISDSTVKYLSLIIKINDSLFNSKQIQQFQNIDFDAQLHQKEILSAKKDFQNQLQKYVLIGSLAVFLMAAVFLYRNNRHRRKSNAILKQQNEEIELALLNLKSTQAQLIQSEKMASLGELTAGIAHEIQNPINFVNNFSDLNKEMLAEMKDDITRGNMEDAKTIADNVIDNEEKINHHGKRVESIVKGMLQHSKRSTGIKELTDINALADEYCKLSYYSMRGKDSKIPGNKIFECEIKMDLDPTLPLVHVIPQDIGRVFLNIFNNAFWACAERGRLEIGAFLSQVSLSTKNLGDHIQISIADNGPGIPQNIIDKIFQPFFTTKPTGLGTGLGLSLAYDIIKAHGGTIEVKTHYYPGVPITPDLAHQQTVSGMNEEKKEVSGSEFIIQLPVQVASK